MAVTVTETQITQAVTSTETQIGSTIATAGVFSHRIDLSPLVGGATPDIYAIREYVKVFDGETEQMLEGSPMQYVGGLAPGIIELPTLVLAVDSDYRITMQKIQGTDRSFDAARLEMG